MMLAKASTWMKAGFVSVLLAAGFTGALSPVAQAQMRPLGPNRVAPVRAFHPGGGAGMHPHLNFAHPGGFHAGFARHLPNLNRSYATRSFGTLPSSRLQLGRRIGPRLALPQSTAVGLAPTTLASPAPSNTALSQAAVSDRSTRGLLAPGFNVDNGILAGTQSCLDKALTPAQRRKCLAAEDQD